MKRNAPRRFVQSPALLLLLCWTFVPGAAELAEAVISFAVPGWAAHGDASEAPAASPEHHCQATVHVCGCHSTAPTLLAHRVSFSELDAAQLAVSFFEGADAEGFRANIFRPPIG